MLAVGSGRAEILDGLVKRLQGGESLPQAEQRFVVEALQQVLKMGAEAQDKLNAAQEKMEATQEWIEDLPGGYPQQFYKEVLADFEGE